MVISSWTLAVPGGAADGGNVVQFDHQLQRIILMFPITGIDESFAATCRACASDETCRPGQRVEASLTPCCDSARGGEGRRTDAVAGRWRRAATRPIGAPPPPPALRSPWRRHRL